MKSVLVASALVLSSSFAFAGHYENPQILDCRVTRMVDYTYFDEALSTDEYPTINVNQDANGEVSIDYGGNAPYEVSEGDTVTLTTKKMSGINVTVVTKYGDKVILQTEHHRTLAKGKVIVQEKGEAPRTIAYVMCDKGFFN